MPWLRAATAGAGHIQFRVSKHFFQKVLVEILLDVDAAFFIFHRAIHLLKHQQQYREQCHEAARDNEPVE